MTYAEKCEYDLDMMRRKAWVELALRDRRCVPWKGQNTDACTAMALGVSDAPAAGHPPTAAAAETTTTTIAAPHTVAESPSVPAAMALDMP